MGGVELLDYRLELDVKAGTLERRVRFRDDEERTTRLVERRFVHIEREHLAALQVEIAAEDWTGTIEVESAVDGRVENTGVERYRDLESKHHVPIEMAQVDDDTVCLKVRTLQSRLEVALAQRTRLYHRNQRLTPERTLVREDDGLIGHRLELELREGSEVTVEKTIALFTSRDTAISEAGLAAHRRLGQLDGRYGQLEARHVLAWELMWRRFDIAMDVEGDSQAFHPALVLRLHVFHLLQTSSPITQDLDVGVPARGWHGEAYRGHVFWDELFIFPLLNLRMPEITRSLLKYRFRRLDAARDAAKEAGFSGAMFPWQSGSSGREESQVVHLNPESGRWLPDNTHLQYHVSADIAYNAWQYFQATDDQEFLLFYGAEIILSVARFFASLATFDEESGRYEIEGVVGPDEYHEAYPDADEPGLDNNAYTNVMAVWVLQTALEVLERLPELRYDELLDLLDVKRSEIERWDDITHKMRICFHGDGIISQFEGYDKLEEFDWEGYRARYDNIQRLDRILEAEGDSPNHYKASKQADVLMLFFLFSDEELRAIFDKLGYAYDDETKQRNTEYYLARTSHGSTLSRVVHSWVTADCDHCHSWQLFLDALRSDIADIQGGTTAEGIHLGAMAGTVDLVQRNYAGIEIRGDDVLRFRPNMPEELQQLHLDIRWRGHSLAVTLTPETLRVSTRPGPAHRIKVGFFENVHLLEAGESHEFELPT